MLGHVASSAPISCRQWAGPSGDWQLLRQPRGRGAGGRGRGWACRTGQFSAASQPDSSAELPPFSLIQEAPLRDPCLSPPLPRSARLASESLSSLPPESCPLPPLPSFFRAQLWFCQAPARDSELSAPHPTPFANLRGPSFITSSCGLLCSELWKSHHFPAERPRALLLLSKGQ